MKLLRFSVYISVIILSFSSCTNQKAESSLLSDKQSCSLEDCPEPQKVIDGSLTIESDAGAYQLNVDKSDVIEIAGKCSDLGYRQNKIFVQVFEGEDTSVIPYLDNQASVNCLNSTTGSMNNQKCFWITQGRGVVDSGLEFPQCYNGRFSFSVRLGRILRTTEGVGNAAAVADDNTNPRRKYLVRFKLSANNGSIIESAWNSTTVDRGVTKPSFSQDSLPFTDYKCDVKINAFKNLTSLTDIKYEIKLTPQYLPELNGAEVDITQGTPIPYVEPIIAPNAHVTNYRVLGIIPGVKYFTKVKAYDTKYPSGLFGGAREASSYSDDLQCGFQTFAMNLQNGAAGIDGPPSSCASGASNKQCNFVVDNMPALLGSYAAPFNSYTSGYIQFMIVKGKTSWEVDFEPSIPPASIPKCGGSASGSGGLTGAAGSLTAGPTPLSSQNVCQIVVPVSTVSTLFTPTYVFRAEYYPNNTCTSAPTNHTYNGTYGAAVRYLDDYDINTGASIRKGAWSAITPCVFKN